MRDSVIVNGVVLTREQIEKAEREINKPTLIFSEGDRVRGEGGYPPEGVVLCPGPSRLIREGWGEPETHVVFVGADGMVYCYAPEVLVKVED